MSIEQEKLIEAKEEMKRADHIIFVSLKYTRTVDVIRNAVDRLINAIGKLIDVVLIYAKENSLIEEIPLSPVERCDAIKSSIDNDHLCQMADFYLFLRKLMRIEYGFEREYRRHVTMSLIYEGNPLTITIDSVTDYYKDVEAYLKTVEKFIQIEKND